MSDCNSATLYLRDLAFLLKELALKAKVDNEAARDGEARAYATGRLMALHEVITLMQQQATAFGIDHTIIGLADIDPERDLL